MWSLIPWRLPAPSGARLDPVAGRRPRRLRDRPAAPSPRARSAVREAAVSPCAGALKGVAGSTLREGAVGTGEGGCRPWAGHATRECGSGFWPGGRPSSAETTYTGRCLVLAPVPSAAGANASAGAACRSKRPGTAAAAVRPVHPGARVRGRVGRGWRRCSRVSCVTRAAGGGPSGAAPAE
jgi:hypothetical protein